MIRSTSHARLNPLTGEWVLVSPHRLQRPWQGQVDEPEVHSDTDYDADCYLCPGNGRANGNRNPQYRGTFAFDNDFPALMGSSDHPVCEDPLYRSRPESGCCRVLCYSDRHNQRLATMTRRELAEVLDAVVAEFSDLDRRQGIAYVQVFENRGTMMGCSNLHPHAQIWATSHVPFEPARELASQESYLAAHGTPLLLDYAESECRQGARLVKETDHFIAVVPYWAVWPYETLLLPNRQIAAPDQLSPAEIDSLATTLSAVLAGYEALFDCPVPYSMGLHPRPSDGLDHPEWQFHIHICPPLLRSASVRKHMVGFEMFGMPQRDLTPEAAADTLRKVIQREGL